MAAVPVLAHNGPPFYILHFYLPLRRLFFGKTRGSNDQQTCVIPRGFSEHPVAIPPTPRSIERFACAFTDLPQNVPYARIRDLYFWVRHGANLVPKRSSGPHSNGVVLYILEHNDPIASVGVAGRQQAS